MHILTEGKITALFVSLHINSHLSCEYHITFSFSLFPLYLIYLARVYFPNSIPQPEDFKT